MYNNNNLVYKKKKIYLKFNVKITYLNNIKKQIKVQIRKLTVFENINI